MENIGVLTEGFVSDSRGMYWSDQWEIWPLLTLSVTIATRGFCLCKLMALCGTHEVPFAGLTIVQKVSCHSVSFFWSLWGSASSSGNPAMKDSKDDCQNVTCLIAPIPAINVINLFWHLRASRNHLGFCWMISIGSVLVRRNIWPDKEGSLRWWLTVATWRHCDVWVVSIDPLITE